MGYEWLANRNLSNHRIVLPSNPRVLGPAAGGEALQIRRTPSGELGVLDLLSESQNLKLQADPRPCRRPLPKVSQKCPKIDHFFDLTKEEEQIQRMGSQWRVLGVHWDLLWCHLTHIFEDL